MDNLPDELLTKVLGHIEYSSEQYKTLRQVNRNFNAVVRSAACCIEVARNQFPELTAFRDYTTLNKQELEKLAIRDRNANKLVEKIALPDDDDNMKALLKAGVLILDYFCTDVWVTPAAKIVLLEWLKKDCVPKPHFILLRYTMNRIFDRKYRTEAPLMAPWLAADHPGFRAEMFARLSGGNEDILTFKRRSFETDTLLRRPVKSLVEDLLGVMEGAMGFYNSMLTTYGKLISAYEHSNGTRGGGIFSFFSGTVTPVHNDQEHDRHLAYLKSFRWRLLSDRDCGCEDSIPPNNDPHFEFYKCFYPESEHDREFGAELQREAQYVAAYWTRLREWKVLGRGMRTGSRRIREEGVPEHIKERVVDMLPEGTSIDGIWA